MCFLIKLKTLKIWLSLLPVVGILGIVLYVQSNKNQEEPKAQNIRTISAIEEDIKRALPDFYSRLEAFFIRKGYAQFAKAAFAERDIISPKDYDDLMQKQRFKKAYLYNLWTELNFDERMACYFFAQEGFFNIARKDTLIELAQEGIIVPVENLTKVKGYLDDWELFSAVFRKYILDGSTNEEIKSFQNFEKANGNAATIQVSAISFVLICFELIGIFDKNFFNEAYAYATGSLGALETLYTLIYRGISTFKFGKTES